MENSKIFKRLVIVMLSLVLVAVCSTSVFAADGDDLFLSVNSTGSTSTNATEIIQQLTITQQTIQQIVIQTQIVH